METILTKREGEIAALIAKGMSNKEIAKQLGLRNQTVRNVLVNVFRKTDTRRRTQLAVKLIASQFSSAATGRRELRQFAAYVPLNDALNQLEYESDLDNPA